MQDRIGVGVLVRMEAIGLLGEARERITREEGGSTRLIPTRAEIDQATGGILELAGEAEGGWRAAVLRHAPRVVAEAGERRARVVEGLADAAERVAAVPRLHRARLGEQPLMAVEVGGRGAAVVLL